MKLYFSPGACSLAPHIVLHELGIPFESSKTNTRDRTTADGSDWSKVSPSNFVPVLMLDNGERLTEVAVILQYLGDLKPESGLVPPCGTMPRYRVQEWLNFIATELHKGFSPMFRPGTPDAYKEMARERLNVRLSHTADQLIGREFLVGNRFTVADAYLYVVSGWTRAAGIDRERWPVLRDYHARIGERPAVKAAREAEGLKG